MVLLSQQLMIHTYYFLTDHLLNDALTSSLNRVMLLV
jgi:hypothetical protein